MVAIVDFNMGNLGSVVKALKRLGAQVKVVSTAKELELADKIILPGVGHFSEGVKNLKPLKKALINKVIINKIPVLGICLGMQLMGISSEEGKGKGLCWINGKNIRFKCDLRIPHVGWNSVNIVKKSKLAVKGEYYFDHAYHLVCPKNNIILTTKYGYVFPSAIQKGNIYGVQFHPEKSHRYGLAFLENFLNV